MGVFDVIVGVDDRHDAEIELCQPLSDALIGPLRIVAVTNLVGGARRRGDAFDQAQRMLPVIGDGLSDKLLFGIERDFIGALRGGQYRDDDAHDRHDDDHADRHDQASLVPPRPFLFPGDLQSRRRQHACTLWMYRPARTLESKAFQ